MGQVHVETNAAPEHLRDITANVAYGDGFQLLPLDAWNFRLERGSRGANFWLGAFSMYHEYRCSVFQPEPGQAVLRMEWDFPWINGGWVGARKLKKTARKLADGIEVELLGLGLSARVIR